MRGTAVKTLDFLRIKPGVLIMSLLYEWVINVVCFCCLLFVSLTGIPGSVEFVEGQGGLPTVMLKHACGASAQVSSSRIRNARCSSAAAVLQSRHGPRRQPLVMLVGSVNRMQREPNAVQQAAG